MGTLIINPYLNQRFLLDQYPGAAAAYSLRKLSSSTTNVVRVRRSSDNAEADFAATEVSNGTLEAWVGVGNNGLVTTWYDQSGNGRDLTQADNTKQPFIIQSGVLSTSNSLPAINHVNAQFLNSSIGLANTVFANTAFTTSLVMSSGKSSAGWVGNSENGEGGIPRLYLNTGKLSYNNLLVVTWDYTIDSSCVNTYSHDGINICKAWHNGVYGGQATEPLLSAFRGTGTLSTNLAARGVKAQELIAYQREFSPENLMRLQENQGNYYGVTIG